ncbi:F-box/RNI-like superfamily protein [Rhynchospora pubera]|uniref:F-box/RNI-like superfamily protein n=1 Tax=Rhynchospora pubera TaxID=906938 RepID=A0AAV8FEE0_9POAL|nr:F-box/RNI-like superfamily protein [Rhynchospora pubera]
MERSNIPSSGGSDCDLISNMPDPILHHILGLLKTREAVQTCVLSKRWVHLWTSLPSLNFDSTEFTALEHPQCDSEEEESSVQRACDSLRFSTFVTTVLLMSNPLHLDTFRVSFGSLISNNLLFKEWVIYALQHNPRVVHLEFLQYPPLSLIHRLYACASLEELGIHYGEKIVTPRLAEERFLRHHQRAFSKYTPRAAINLPNLKKLSFRNDYFSNNNLKDLLSGCPLLQYLSLEQCYLEEDEIAHETLQHLTTINCRIPSIISATNLVTFYYISSSPIPIPNMPSLTHACVTVNTHSRSWEGLASFFSGLVNVEVLELDVSYVKPQEEYVLPELPIFQKVHDLSVGFCMCSGFLFWLVTWILKKVPNLKKLTLQQQKCYGFCCGEEADTSDWTGIPLRAAISHCKNLEVVNVKYSRSDSTLKRLLDALVDGTIELQNVNIILSKH